MTEFETSQRLTTKVWMPERTLALSRAKRTVAKVEVSQHIDAAGTETPGSVAYFDAFRRVIKPTPAEKSMLDPFFIEMAEEL